MTAQNTAAWDQIILTVWREYRLNLVLLMAGIVTVVVSSVYSVWANSTGNYPTSFWTELALNVTLTAGGMLTLLAGTIAYYHRSFLRQNRRST